MMKIPLRINLVESFFYLEFNTNQGSYNGIGSGSAKITMTQASSQDQNVIVYASKTGTKYHVDGCSSLSKSKIPISLSDAKSKGLTPCSKCKPPQ
ncbi:hypothetical protein [Clostridium estertheticum]|uniref:hypothetical protein n=1 Tax=Clostridium estertheticum TaxID=238834 RepID=UPI001C0BB5A7|nr:hypothetical protein [Clostridium estertheticum]MBU3187667.1 hypothetical protein [Clostridium estertheticum]